MLILVWFLPLLKAGIPANNLIVALEPEAASIFCQFLQTEKKDCSDSGFTVTAEGTEYMVVDLGGKVYQRILNKTYRLK